MLLRSLAEEGACGGMLPDGSPKFPAKVGGPRCAGATTSEMAPTSKRSPVVVMTHMFDIGDTPAAKTIVTDGYELADLNLPFLPAVTAGIGDYQFTRDEQTQTLLGFSAVNDVSLRVKLDLMR